MRGFRKVGETTESGKKTLGLHVEKKTMLLHSKLVAKPLTYKYSKKLLCIFGEC